MKTNVELFQLAEDILAGKVFTDKMIRIKDMPDMLYKIFLSLASVMPYSQYKELSLSGPILIYAYVDDSTSNAYPLGMVGVLKGYPVFTNFHYLPAEEYAVVRKAFEIIQSRDTKKSSIPN